jgi:polar amino acid transport system substrate-binding protein
MNIAHLFKRTFCIAAAVGALALASTASHAQTVADIVKKGKVTIGVVSGVPPFGMADPQGNPVGYDVDVANLVAKYIGVPVEIVALTPPSRIPALESGKVDFLIATLGPTPERAKVVAFTIGYSSFDMTVFAPTAAKYVKLQDLASKKVGVPRGSPQDSNLTRLAVPGTTVVRFEDDATAAQALISGQVDAVVLPGSTGNDIFKARAAGKFGGKFALYAQASSMALRRDAHELRQWLNTTIYSMKQTGELDVLSRKWQGTPLANLPVF